MLKLKLKTKLLFTCLPLTLVLSACQEEEILVEDKITQVSTQALESLLVDYVFKRPARAISLNDSVLSTELNAPVAKIYAQVGDFVKQNSPLVALSCGDERNRLKQADAQLKANRASAKLSRLDYERAQQLFEQRTISEQEMNRLNSEHERSQANQSNASASYQLAKSNVSKCIIRAPFDAIVVERTATLGQLARPGTAMVRIIDAANLEVSAYLSNEEAEVIKNSIKPYFSQDQKAYFLNIRAITPAIDSIRRTREIRLTFNDEKPLPGSSGELVWSHPNKALPSEYLSQRDGQLGILFAEKNDNAYRVGFIAIPNAKEGQPTPLNFSDSLKADTIILIDGRFGVSVGDSIQLTKP